MSKEEGKEAGARAIQGKQKRERENIPCVCVFTELRGSARYTAATTVVVSVESVVQESRQSGSSLALPGSSSSSVSNTHGQSILEHTVPAEQSSRISPCHRPSCCCCCYTATFFSLPKDGHTKSCAVSLLFLLLLSVSSGATDSLGTELASGGRSERESEEETAATTAAHRLLHQAKQQQQQQWKGTQRRQSGGGRQSILLAESVSGQSVSLR